MISQVVKSQHYVNFVFFCVSSNCFYVVCVLIGFAKVVVDVRAPLLGDINIVRMAKVAK